MTPLARIVDFLNGIGIACTPARIADASFLPGVRVVAGALV